MDSLRDYCPYVEDPANAHKSISEHLSWCIVCLRVWRMACAPILGGKPLARPEADLLVQEVAESFFTHGYKEYLDFYAALTRDQELAMIFATVLAQKHGSDRNKRGE